MTRSLHLHAWGPDDAPRLVCLHGVTGWGGHFARLAEEALAPAHRMLAPDLVGHGSSPYEPPWRIADHLDAVLETVGAQPAVWLGHSFGGRLALELAAARPELVEGLVLLDPAIHVPPHVALFSAESSLADRSYTSFDEAVERRFEESMLHGAARVAVASELERHLTQDTDGRWRYRYSQAAVVAAYGEMAVEPPPFTAASVRTLVVAGRESYIPYETFAAAHRAALGALLEVVIVPGGHTVLWDAPQETAAAIAAFLA
jgi:lipase